MDVVMIGDVMVDVRVEADALEEGGDVHGRGMIRPGGGASNAGGPAPKHRGVGRPDPRTPAPLRTEPRGRARGARARACALRSGRCGELADGPRLRSRALLRGDAPRHDAPGERP